MVFDGRRHILAGALAALALLLTCQLSAQVPHSVKEREPKVQPSVPVRPGQRGQPAAQQKELVVLRSDARGLVIEYRPRFFPPREMQAGRERTVLYDFAGARPSGQRQPGMPDIRYRSFPLALPGAQGAQVRVTSSDYEEIPGMLLAPVPRLVEREGVTLEQPVQPSAEAYAASGFLPAQPAELAPPGQVRELFLSELRLYPVQFNPAGRMLRRYTRLLVEVTYGPSAARAGGVRSLRAPGTELQEMLLNSNVAGQWNVPLARSAAPINSVLSSGAWYRITVKDEGIYKLDPAKLTAAGVNLSGVDPRTIRIFGNGGKEVPEAITAPRPADLVENAIFVAGEADGQFNTDDYILFYGKGTRGWNYDAANRTIRHYINHYGEENYYWLTYGGQPGKRMADQPSSAAAATSICERFTDGVFVEEEKVNLVYSGKDWFGQEISTGSSFTHLNNLPGLITNDAILYRYALVSHSDAGGLFTVRETGTVIGQHGIGATYGDSYGAEGIFAATGSSTLATAQSQLNFAYSSGSSGATGWIDWVEILYPRLLWGVSDYIKFRSPDTTGVVEYRLQQFGTKPWIFNVTDPANVRLLSGVEGSYLFRASEQAGGVSDYVAASAGSWKVPATIVKAANQDLHGSITGADFIILTSPEFRAAADRLKAYREQPAHGGLRTVVVDVNQIYNEFAGGIPDISGIRDFLKYAFDNWSPRPAFVLFLGAASYDYKGLLGSKTSFVPTWQNTISLDDVNSIGTDDFFVAFGSDFKPWMVSGRISSRTPAEANVAVDKIMRYEASSVKDAWKMRIIFVGDDAYTSENGEVGDMTLHSDDAEDLAVNHTPEEFEKVKIYEAEYPTVYSAQGRRKPGAYQAIIDRINEGALMFNFAGHGNPTQLAHENIFNVLTSIPQLVNTNRLSVFFLATCNFSQFDDPKRESGGELLLHKPDGGAVGVIAASRKVFASGNHYLATNTYDRLFTRDAAGHLVVERPAVALFQHKATGNYDNDQKFFYLGDPTMRLQYPQGYAVIDSINSQPVDSVGGIPRTSPVELRSLAQVTVTGTVRQPGGAVDNTFNGSMALDVNDANQKRTIINFYPGAPPWTYQASGGLLFRGDNSVVGGRFRASFIVPKDIDYADTSARARMVAYFYNAATDGAAYTGKIRVAGTDSTAVNDSKGPKISLYLNNRSFRPGDLVNEAPVLYVDLSDSNGINTSGSGIGHRIEAWINNSSQSKDITAQYVSKKDDFRQGTVQYPLKDLPAGQNTLRVRAWDSFNNSSVAETYFEVASSDNLTISDVFNYPNPFSSGTSFTFRQNQSSPLSVTVKIYTVAGRLIQSIQTVSAGDSYVRIPWDGRDRDGDILANGVYLYKLVVRTMDGRFTSEALGKLAVLK